MKHLILFIALLVSNGLAIARTTMSDQLSKTTRMNTQSEIYFAGGCFWGTEHFMKQIDGVTNTRVGYANGKISIKTRLTNKCVTIMPDSQRLWKLATIRDKPI